MRSSQAAHVTVSRPRIREPELDMCRSTEAVETGLVRRICARIVGLVSNNRQVVAPMRSIARELEESWPISDG